MRMQAMFGCIGRTPSVKLLYAELYDCDMLLEDVVDLFGILEGIQSWGEDEIEGAIDTVKP